MSKHGRSRTRLRWVRERIESGVLCVAAVLAISMSAGCAAAVAAPGPHRTAVVTAAHDTELGVAVGADERGALADLAADPDVDDAAAYVLAAGRDQVDVVDLEPRRPNGDIERGGRIAELVDERLTVLDDAVRTAAAQGTSSDPLPALDAAGRTDAGRIVLLTAGLGLTGPLDPRAAGWDRDPVAMVDEAEAAGLVPDLSGRELVVSGLGRTTGEQAPLGVAEQRWLRSLWTTLCERTGARCRIDDGVRPATGPSSTLAGPVVAVPVPAPPVVGPSGEQVVDVPAALLFGPDSCVVPDPAAATTALSSVVDLLRDGSAVVHISGRTAPVGPGDGVELSRCRAERAADLLRAAGVPPHGIGRVSGDGDLLDPPGPADPDRLAGLRRVIFTVVPQEEEQ